MEAKKKEQFKGFIGSVMFHTVLIAILLFVKLGFVSQNDEVEVLIEFGDATGFGMAEEDIDEPPTYERSAPIETPAPVTPTPRPQPAMESFVTQNFEETIGVEEYIPIDDIEYQVSGVNRTIVRNVGVSDEMLAEYRGIVNKYLEKRLILFLRCYEKYRYLCGSQ